MSGETCNDGNYCTIDDRCNSSLECVGGSSRNCSDGDPCTTDTCNESADRCDNDPAPAGTGCSDGEFCTSPDECDGAGNCVPGPPRSCDDDRDCTMDSCDEAGDTCVNDLDADACLIRGQCFREGDVDPDPRFMDLCEQCVPALSLNRFSQVEAGTSCGISACSDGVYTSPPRCDIAGDCIPGMTSPCESGMCADVTSCIGCLEDDDCPAGEFCAGTGCAPLLDVGQSCPRDAACTSGECADGVCCGEPCDGPCLSCAMSGMPGTCVPHPASTNPEGACGTMGCDGAGACIPDPIPDGAIDGSVDGGDTGVVGGDTGVVGDDGGENSLTAHGSGCVACAVGAPEEGRNPALLALVSLLAALGFRRRRRR